MFVGGCAGVFAIIDGLTNHFAPSLLPPSTPNNRTLPGETALRVRRPRDQARSRRGGGRRRHHPPPIGPLATPPAPETGGGGDGAGGHRGGGTGAGMAEGGVHVV